MPKMRVHELAKQLDKSSKDIITFLQDKSVEVKNHMSTLEDNQVQLVKSNFSESSPKGNQDSPKEDTQVKKKSNITQVFHPQNSQSRQRTPGNRNQRMQNDNRTNSKEPLKKPVKEPDRAKQDVEVKQNTADMADRPENTQRNSSQVLKKPFTGEKTTGRENRTGEGNNHSNQGANRGNQGSRSNQGASRPNQGSYTNQGTSRPNQGSYTNQGASRPNQGSYTNQGAGRPNQGSYTNQGASRPNQGSYTNQGAGRPNQGSHTNQSASRPNQGSYTNQSASRPNQGSYTNQSASRPNQGSHTNQGASHSNQNASRTNQGASQSSQSASRPSQGNQQNKGSYPNQGGNRPNQGGNRPNQGGNRPNQGGNRPNQGGRRPNQGGNRPNQGGRNRYRQAQPATVQKQEVQEETIKTISLPEYMTIRELADKMKIQPSVIVKKLFLQGTVVTVNQEIDFAQAEEIAMEFNCIAEAEVKVDVIAELLKEEEEDTSKMSSRPPVVCVMGHVDHGKTSLLDAIRDTHVIDREAGGITQHIGAYVVSINGQKITFLDTPGHEAFTSMRMRGANATDIAILVVAADDGVMPQTIEAINHAKAAKIEIIVAINKIDKPSANIDRVKQELAEQELIAEDWGGSTIFVPVSAHTHEGIDELLEMILLTSEVCELKANPKRNARGLVIEAELDKGKGSVATVLVQKGTLRVGDAISAGSCYGKVRAMMDDQGRRVQEAGPSTPVEILGLNDVPNAGEIFMSMENDKEARSFAETFISQGRERMLDDTRSRMSLDDLFTQIQAGNLKELDIIVKADVQGSVEAVKQSLVKLSNEEVVVKVIHGGVGAINESDVILASASNAIIIGFNVRPDATAKEIADREGVDLRLYKVIYNAIEDVEAAMKGMLDPIFEEKIIGHAEVRQTFKASGVGTIAGSYVLDGLFERGCKIRITREGEQIFDGLLASLKRFKDDVKEVKTGYECGLVPEKFNDINEGDIFEAYKMVEVPR